MGEKIIIRDITEDITQSYLEYGIDVIVGRALPDVRDGCKPVHRRILHAMEETSNFYDKPFKKSARTVGEVLGKYHPHGDSSVYDAMVRMAQPFSLRYPFVDGHGNFGSIDGDSAAAMRYTEARMSKIAALMMEDIDKDTVDMVKNYDGTLDEPSVLPAKIPNLLVNGVEGIAVGFATKMPPHNLSEVMDGVIATIDNPEITVEELMKHIKAPDFPSGGIIMGLDGVRSAYATGQGEVKIRSKYIIEDIPNGNSNRQQIVFTEIPYQVNKAKLVDKIHCFAVDKIIEDISEVRDESSVRDGLRIVIELKKTANVAKIIKNLFKKTELETSFCIKSNALVPTKNKKLVPRMLTLIEIIKHFIKHRTEIIQRKYQYLLKKAYARQHIIDGLIKAISIVDDVIATIRANKSVAEAQSALIAEYGFSDIQASAILDFKLQKLTGLEIEKLNSEKQDVDKSISEYTDILSTEDNILKEVRKDCEDVLNKYGDDRKTEIQASFNPSNDEDKDFDDTIVAQDVVVTITNTGYIKRVPLETYSAQSRGGKGVKGINNKNIDIISQMFVTNTKCLLLCFGSDGRMYKLPVSAISEESRIAKGQYLNALIEAESTVKIVAITEIHDSKYEGYILMFSRLGGIKKIKLADLITKRRSINAINIRNEDDSLINACLVQESNNVFIATNKGIIICFDHKDLNAHGRASGTVRAIKLNPDDFVVNADVMKIEDSLLTVTNTGVGKRTNNADYKIQAHGGKGSLNYKLKKGENIVSVVGLNNEKDILIACDNGKLIRTPAESIRDLSRVSRGVKLVNLSDKENVVCVSSVVKSEEDLPETEIE